MTQITSKEFLQQSLDLIEHLHNNIIKESGGENGIRDEGGLYNSVYRINNFRLKHFDNPSVVGAFVYMELARRHHFNDGNKRTAHAFAKMMIYLMGFHLRVEYKDATQFIMKIAEYKSKVTSEEINDWIQSQLNTIDEKDTGTYINQIIQEITYGRKI